MYLNCYPLLRQGRLVHLLRLARYIVTSYYTDFSVKGERIELEINNIATIFQNFVLRIISI